MSELDEMTDEMTEVTGPVSSDRAQRFYDRIRERIRGYLGKKAHLDKSASISCSFRTCSCCCGASSTTAA